MQNDWYKAHKTWRAILLMPLSWLFLSIANKRKILLHKNAYKSTIPIIIVGNITIGGTGKTPVVQAICNYLQQKGYHPAVITRGFGGKTVHYPFVINENISPNICGDEPFMLNKLLQTVPVVVSPKRSEAVEYIENQLTIVDVVISDDGLQHYAMNRDIEIAVIDGERLFGNGLCLPAGPLREPIARLQTVDMIIVNGLGGGDIHIPNKTQYNMQLLPQWLVNLKTGQRVGINEFIISKGKACYGIAGIGNPKRFFRTIENLGFSVDEHAFKDHHSFTIEDFKAINDKKKTIIMTYKDAVKCQSFSKSNWYYLAILPEIEADFFAVLSEKLSLCLERKK